MAKADKKEFQRAYDLKTHKEAIWSLVLAFIVISISGPLDYFGFPESGPKMLVIVFGYEAPIVLAACYVFRSPASYLKYSDRMPYVGFASSSGIILCLLIIQPTEPMFQGFTNGAVGTAMVWIFVSNKTRPVHALIACLILDILFNVVWILREFHDDAIFAGSNFAMFAFILFGFWGTRFAEKVLYQDFVKSEIIRKEKEEIENLNKDLTKSFEVNNMLTSLMSHDVRAPLNSLRGVLNLFTKGVITDSEFRKCLNQVSTTIESTGELLSNLLLWSSTKKTGFAPAKEKFLLRFLVEETFELLKLSSSSRVKLVNNVPPDLMVFADEPMIGTVLRNLISNAIQHTKQGSVTVSTNVSRFITEVVVQDTGVGINVSAARKLFTWKDPCSGNVKVSGSSFDNGFGFGLFISKEFVEQHDGILTYVSSHSNEGERGTIFYFTLPNFEMLDQNQQERAIISKREYML